ncbi:unnamed protein product [Peronospora destructor]|uniref:RING-type domain-containing protein n=1 Tax=Peronospora destructor TaxID=86335 RepID=A0AAV0URC3_9STRA|nr:unnamed protein product [Peronospora destructor]
MFLRSLYGPRMPQSLHPRVDPQASSYWEEDTTSSQEIARAMEEVDACDTGIEEEGKKKNNVLTAAALAGDEHVNRHDSIPTLSSQLALRLESDGMALEGLTVEDINSSPVNAQLSPAGLISIAAADVDEAATNHSHNVPPFNGELDLAFIHSLRRASREPIREVKTYNPLHVANTALTQLLGSFPPFCGLTSDDSVADGETAESESKLFSLIRRHLNMLGSTSFFSSSVAHNAAEGQSKLRFLSLLRRINELRSQQVDADSWDGLPYPQIITLPTFKYQLLCCDEFKTEEEVRALPCLHFYHRECIDQWLMCHRQCPICKHVVAVY